MKKPIAAALLILLLILLSAAVSCAFSPTGDGRTAPEKDALNETSVPGVSEAENVPETLLIDAAPLFYGYGFSSFICEKDGVCRFSEQNPGELTWKVYILDAVFDDAERFIPQAYDCALEGNGSISLKKGDIVYVYCPYNEWTDVPAPEGCRMAVTFPDGN